MHTGQTCAINPKLTTMEGCSCAPQGRWERDAQHSPYQPHTNKPLGDVERKQEVEKKRKDKYSLLPIALSKP